MAEIKYLEINADDRSIIIPAGENLLGVENDNEGARKYFRCPKIVGDNIDLTKSDVYINAQNASGEKSGKDRYPVQNMTASGDNVTLQSSRLRSLGRMRIYGTYAWKNRRSAS